MLILTFTVPIDKPPARVVDLAAAFHAHGAFLHRNVLRWVVHPEEADDVVQDVFLIANRKQEELDPEQNLRGWLYKTARNVVKHRRRAFARRKRLAEAFLSEPTNDVTELGGAMDRTRDAELVRRCTSLLPETQRDVFILFELEGLTGPEIATLLEISENAIWTRLVRARKKFEVILRREAEPAEELSRRAG